MIIKKFVPCIYLYHEHAVRNLTDTTIVDTDPVRLADYYCEHNADELIVFDMSEGDAEHDAALDIIKERFVPGRKWMSSVPAMSSVWRTLRNYFMPDVKSSSRL